MIKLPNGAVDVNQIEALSSAALDYAEATRALGRVDR